MGVSDDREAIKNAVAQEVAGADQLQQIRERAQANLTDRQREVLNYPGIFREDTITDELVAALRNVGVRLERWVNEIMAKPNELVRFYEAIPFIDVFIRLILLHSRNTSRVYGKKDVRDLVWLAVALTYSNVIARETYWTTLAAPLGAKYSTILVNQPEALPDVLAAAGCCRLIRHSPIQPLHRVDEGQSPFDVGQIPCRQFLLELRHESGHQECRHLVG